MKEGAMKEGAMKEDALRELTRHILPYWAEKTIDEKDGGFIGRIDGNNTVVPDAPKGLVLNARILWTFAESALFLEDEKYGELAERAGAYLYDYFWDADQGGGYWMLDHKGEPIEPLKRTYAQAFLLYGVVSWYRLTGDKEIRAWAQELFYLLETHALDTAYDGYFEVFDANWRRLPAERLSERDPVAAKSSNTQLHVLEAYTRLFTIWKDDEVADRLRAMIRLFLDHIIDKTDFFLHGAFDADWKVLTNTVSFGHDIEASWLLLEAARVLGDQVLLRETEQMAVRMVDAVLARGTMEDGSIINEIKNGVEDNNRHWWSQAEAVVGFINAWQLTGSPDYMEAALKNWRYIQTTIVDHEAGEWFHRVDHNGRPYPEDNKVGPWKCPYHNARACLEILKRV